MKYLGYADTVASCQDRFPVKRPGVYSFHHRRANKERIPAIVLTVYRVSTTGRDARQGAKSLYLPMRWNLSQPLDTGVLHRDIGVEALCNGVDDECGPLLFQQFDQLVLLGDEHVNSGRFAIKKPRDLALLVKRRKSDQFIQIGFTVKVLDPNALFDRAQINPT